MESNAFIDIGLKKMYTLIVIQNPFIYVNTSSYSEEVFLDLKLNHITCIDRKNAFALNGVEDPAMSEE